MIKFLNNTYLYWSHWRQQIQRCLQWWLSLYLYVSLYSLYLWTTNYNINYLACPMNILAQLFVQFSLFPCCLFISIFVISYTLLLTSFRVSWWCESCNQGKRGSSRSRAHPLWRLGEKGPLCRLLIHYSWNETYKWLFLKKVHRCNIFFFFFKLWLYLWQRQNFTFWAH